MKRRRDGSRAGSNGALGLDLLLDSIAKVRGVESSYRINNDFSFRMNLCSDPWAVATCRIETA